jgi:dolichol-phosphate mannosyltransferase
MRTSVVLATYKEKENLVRLIKAIFNAFKKNDLACDIVVVDDNSPDGTADSVRKAFGSDSRVKVIVRTEEKGLATAIRRGIDESEGDVLVFMDTDFSHDPNLIPKMVKLTKGYDIVSGSRYVQGGGIQSKWYRTLTTTAMEMYIRIMLGLKVKDYTNGFLAVRRSLLNKLNLDKIFYGYGDYCIRLFYHSLKKGAHILEIPAVYKFREEGVSKTNVLKHGIQYGLEVLKLKIFG